MELEEKELLPKLRTVIGDAGVTAAFGSSSLLVITYSECDDTYKSGMLILGGQLESSRGAAPPVPVAPAAAEALDPAPCTDSRVYSPVRTLCLKFRLCSIGTSDCGCADFRCIARDACSAGNHAYVFVHWFGFISHRRLSFERCTALLQLVVRYPRM